MERYCSFHDGHVIVHDRHGQPVELTPEGAFDFYIWLSEHYLALVRMLAQGVPPFIDEAAHRYYDGSLEESPHSHADQVSLPIVQTEA